jgi:hypothetical protein
MPFVEIGNGIGGLPVAVLHTLADPLWKNLRFVFSGSIPEDHVG